MERIDAIADRVMRARRGEGEWEIDSCGVMTRHSAKDQDHPVQPRGFSCRLCRDWGVIPFEIREPREDGTSAIYQSNARCRCARGQEMPDRFPTWKDLFGRWPDDPPPQKPFGRETLIDGKWVSE